METTQQRASSAQKGGHFWAPIGGQHSMPIDIFDLDMAARIPLSDMLVAA